MSKSKTIVFNITNKIAEYNIVYNEHSHRHLLKYIFFLIKFFNQNLFIILRRLQHKALQIICLNFFFYFVALKVTFGFRRNGHIVA